MKRITTLLMGAGALALAACSGGDEGGNNAAANMADENAIANVMFEEANSLGNGADAAPAGAQGAEDDTNAATPSAPAASPPEVRPPNAAPKTAPAPRRERPKETAPRPAPTPEPVPPPKTDCTPEHRAAGHC